MEALVAVGLAGNVVQFVQFSGQLISLAKEIKRKGAPSSLLGLRKVAQDLTQQTRIISTRLKANAATLEQDEQHLLDVAKNCEKAGLEFIAYIDDLIKTSKPSSRLGSVQSSMKIKWHHTQIEEYISRLDKLQGSLLLATMLSLRTRETGSHHEILGHLKSIETGNDTSRQNNDELLRAISLLCDLVQQQSGPKLDMLQKQMDLCMEDVQKSRFTVTNAREGEILRWLDFRQRTWRFEEVEEAHQTTFEWIFRKPHANTPWHDFSAYLSGGEISLPYFINGKAGSGKSTLMKYIASHVQTKERLRNWAGQHELLSPHFFFWNVGTPLQKSHVGMLRSLLHSILAHYKDLIPAVFPTLYANGVPLGDDEPPTYIELKGAFERLKVRSTSFLRICIFIDGVDEFDGDHRDMSTFLCSLTSSTIKVVVSSRPINACLDVFRGCPTLRLQDLTQDDIRIFIRDQLSLTSKMTKFQTEWPGKAAILKAEIQERAEGVFLWVRLVTRILLQGLDNGDNFDELLPMLRALPTDLRALYARIMQQMPSDYQVQASQMLQIFEWWRLYSNDEPLELLLLSFAIQKPNPALDLGMDTWDTRKQELHCDRAKDRIRSRCCGLLEVRGIPSTSIFWPSTPVVAYLHRSVAEFVTDRDIWEHIVSLTSDTTFSPRTHIACGILFILKTSHPLPGHVEWWRTSRITERPEYTERILDLAMDVCRQIPDTEDSFILQYMDALDKAMTPKSQSLTWDSIDEQYFMFHMHWSLRMTPTCLGSDLRWFSHGVPNWVQADICSFAAYNGILSYLKAANRSSKLADVESSIVFALGSWIHGKCPFSDRRETLSFLLQILAERSTLTTKVPVRENTLWELAALVAYDLSNGPHHSPGRSLEPLVPETVEASSWFFESPNMGPTCFDIFDMDASRSSVRDRQVSQDHHPFSGNVGRDTSSGLGVTNITSPRQESVFEGDKTRKRKLEELDPGTLEIKPTRDKQRKQEHAADGPQVSDYLLFGISEEYVLTAEREHDELFQSVEKIGCGVEVSNAQQTVEILRLFLSTTDKPRELLNKVIDLPGRPIFTPLDVLRKVLAQERREKSGWASEFEYQFLYQFVGRSEAC